MKKVLFYVKSLDFAFVLCLIAMLGQSFHSYYAFYDVSNLSSDWWRIPESLILIFAFDSFTLFYLMRGRTRLARFYTACLFIMNCYYYISSGPFTLMTLFGIFLSAIIPISIYFVAEEVKLEYEKGKEIDTMAALLTKLEAEVKEKAKSKTIKL